MTTPKIFKYRHSRFLIKLAESIWLDFPQTRFLQPNNKFCGKCRELSFNYKTEGSSSPNGFKLKLQIFSRNLVPHVSQGSVSVPRMGQGMPKRRPHQDERGVYLFTTLLWNRFWKVVKQSVVPQHDLILWNSGLLFKEWVKI